VLINGVNTRLMRLVTHHDVTRAACERALDIIAEVVRLPRPAGTLSMFRR